MNVITLLLHSIHNLVGIYNIINILFYLVIISFKIESNYLFIYLYIYTHTCRHRGILLIDPLFYEINLHMMMSMEFLMNIVGFHWFQIH